MKTVALGLFVIVLAGILARDVLRTEASGPGGVMREDLSTIQHRGFSPRCPEPEWSAPSRYGAARASSPQGAAAAARLLDRVGDRVRELIDTGFPSLVDLRVQPEGELPGELGHTSRSPGRSRHVCMRQDLSEQDEMVLAHELHHFWAGSWGTLPILEEGRAELLALRAYPRSTGLRLRKHQFGLTRLIARLPDWERGSDLLVQAALAPSWSRARQQLAMEGNRCNGELYALGLEFALRMESGGPLTAVRELSTGNSLLLALRPHHAPVDLPSLRDRDR